jgi:hypothetical protein
MSDTEFTQLEHPRPLSQVEREVLVRLLAKEFPGSAQLREQMKSVVVSLDHGSHCPTVGLTVDPNVPRARVTTRIPVTAFATASDGMQIDVSVHVVDGYLSELEAFRHDDKPLAALPQVHALEVMVLSEGDDTK